MNSTDQYHQYVSSTSWMLLFVGKFTLSYWQLLLFQARFSCAFLLFFPSSCFLDMRYLHSPYCSLSSYIRTQSVSRLEPYNHAFPNSCWFSFVPECTFEHWTRQQVMLCTLELEVVARMHRTWVCSIFSWHTIYPWLVMCLAWSKAMSQAIGNGFGLAQSSWEPLWLLAFQILSLKYLVNYHCADLIFFWSNVTWHR